MKSNLTQLLLGVACGLVLPAAFVSVYLWRFYPGGEALADAVAGLWGSALFGKLMLLGLMPDLVLTFVLYKLDRFRFGAGVMLGMLPFLVLGVI